MEILLALIIIYIIFTIPSCFGTALIFKKMNLSFKKGLIPFYNKIILIQKYKLPQYHLILIFIPFIRLYSNFLINDKLSKQYKKDKIYTLELTFLPFIYNIFLGLEINKKQEQTSNYFEDQKTIYQDKEKKIEDDYLWHPKQKVKSDTIYKASRNKLNAKVNINIQKTNEIIDNKKQIIIKKEKENKKICPNCGAKINEKAEICFICGTELR